MRLAVVSLWQRELVRFLRDRSRLTGSLLQPVLFWLLFTGALQGSFRPAGQNYGTWFFVGTLAMIALFTAIFATITVIEDRQAGFLQGVLVAPVPRLSIVAGQAAGSTTLAVIQGGLLLLLAPVAGLRLTLIGVASSLGVMVVLGFTLSGLGLLLAWRMDSTQGFHAIMNLLLLPMWLLSGAFFPAEGAPWWLGWAMRINPMTYGMAALRRSLYLGAGTPAPLAALPGLGLSLGIIALFGGATFVVAAGFARRAAP